MPDKVQAVGMILLLACGALTFGYVVVLIELGGLRRRLEDLERWKNNG